MTEKEVEVSTLDLEKIGFGTKQAGFSFLIQMTLLGPAIALTSLIFNSTISGLISWCTVVFLNIYIIYHSSKSKLTLDDLHIKNEADRQAVLYDYQAYFNVKQRLWRLIYKSGIALVATFVFIIFIKVKILGAVLTPLIVITVIFIWVSIIFIYCHLPQFIALYYLTHHYLDVNPQEIEYALEREWEKQYTLEQNAITISESDELLTKNEIITPSPAAKAEKPTITHQKNRTHFPQPPEQSKPIRKFSEIEILMKMLRDQFTQLSIIHVRSFNQLIEVLQYLEDQRRVMSLANRNKLLQLIQQLHENLSHALKRYFNYHEDERGKYQSEYKVIPDLWLKKYIEETTENLIESTKFVYERDLTSFTDHQKFIDQKFTFIEDFNAVSLKPYVAHHSSQRDIKSKNKHL